LVILLGVASLHAMAGCATQPPADPVRVLGTTGLTASDHLAAIQVLEKQDPLSADASQTVRRVLTGLGYNIEVRQAAFNMLAQRDRKVMMETLQTTIGRLESFEFRRWMIEQIAAHDWKDFTIVIVNSWAQPVPIWGSNDLERPEYKAMRILYGPRNAQGAPIRQADERTTDEAVVDALFAVLMDANPIRQAALRARTWELLMRIGQRERLQALVANTAFRPDDVMLRDIRQLSVDLGILPETREELLWLAKLRQTATPSYWKMAGDALKQIPEAERRRFELRGVAVAIAASRYQPELLGLSTDELFARVSAALRAKGAGKHSANFQGYGEGHTELIGTQRDQVKWIDLMAMLLAMDLTEKPQVRKALFDIGDRDQQDRRTEYGGVIRINDNGMYEVVEVAPRVTGSDSRYEAPQEAFDLGYTALFHFHFHAQSYENGSYAGPHMGDFMYANATRANCLVFAFIKRGELNVDYYRHGPVVVDLGTIQRN
jgi:transposase